MALLNPSFRRLLAIGLLLALLATLAFGCVPKAPVDIAPYLASAEELVTQGMYEEAFRQLEAARNLAPGRDSVRRRLTEVKALAASDTALKGADAALAEADYAGARDLLILVCAGHPRYDEAQSLLMGVELAMTLDRLSAAWDVEKNCLEGLFILRAEMRAGNCGCWSLTASSAWRHAPSSTPQPMRTTPFRGCFRLPWESHFRWSQSELGKV